MRAREYYKSTRMVDTMNWTLDMAMSFAEEYHKNEMEALRIHDVSQQRKLLMAFKEWEANKCKLPWDANIDEVVEQYLAINCG
jgi:hypothetical protein